MFPTIQNVNCGFAQKPNIITTILVNERILIADVCRIVGMYAVVTDDDRIKFMLANRDSPEIFLYNTAVVEDLDEVMTIKYAREDGQWMSMTILDRLVSFANQIFTASIKVGDLRGDAKYTFKMLVDHMRECEGVINDPNKKTNPNNLFASFMSMSSRTVFRLSSDWMLL